jgi:hypothetical protein
MEDRKHRGRQREVKGGRGRQMEAEGGEGDRGRHGMEEVEGKQGGWAKEKGQKKGGGRRGRRRTYLESTCGLLLPRIIEYLHLLPGDVKDVVRVNVSFVNSLMGWKEGLGGEMEKGEGEGGGRRGREKGEGEGREVERAGGAVRGGQKVGRGKQLGIRRA